MKAKKALLLLLVCALALLVFTPAATAKPDERPFKGVLTGEVWFTPGGELGLPPNPNPPFLYTVSEATGDVSHLGYTEMAGVHPAATDFAGQMVLTAANGDKVYVDYVGVGPNPQPGVPATLRVTSHWTFAGGTGRFEDASGSADSVAYLEFSGDLSSPEPLPAVWYFEGTIGY